MFRERFFNKKFEYLTLVQIIEITGATPYGAIDLQAKVYDVGTLEKADSTQISFFHSGSYFEKFLETKAGFCLLEEKNADRSKAGINVLVHKNPYFAYAKIAESFYEEKPAQFSDNLIDPSSEIGEGTKIAPNAFIGRNVKIGKNCVIGPNASITEGCIIGDNSKIGANSSIGFAVIGSNCFIYPGARIGQDGFGFAHNAGINHKIIQIGIVEIGDNVEVGANTCIDRGAIENTVIGDGVKLDNLNQIGHNVIIGKGTVIAGCSALAGSSKIGNFVQIGGGANISGHLTISDGAKVAGMSGVMRNIDPMQTVAGIPAMPVKQWHRTNIMLAKMLEKKIDSNE
jgi:UDP-3-O-[3-hydroxymyristoyl] glucosamine N-acyltransferase